MNNKLKTARVILALLFFIPIVLYFLDFTGKLPVQFHFILQLQLVPALISGMLGVLIAMALLSLFFGRIYCSVICPAGILQDIFIRISGKGRKWKQRKKYRFHYRKPLYINILRYTLLVLVIFFFCYQGSTHLLLWLDPYSNFGRIASNLFLPGAIFINNVLADWMIEMDNYKLIYIAINNLTVVALVSAAVTLLVFMILSVMYGRLFCNSLCPVGAFLSIFSRFSLFRISFDKKLCNSCGSCEMTCKSECINSKTQKVDTSRCVDCFNCISSCRKGGLKYKFGFSLVKKEKNTEIQEEIQPEMNSRRSFIATGAMLMTTIPVISQVTKNETKNGSKQQPVLPPGAFNKKRFENRCTACHLCVTKCPNQIIKPAGLQYGFSYLLKPHLAYIKGYCNYDCTICSEVCPNKALEALSPEKKVTTQIGIAHFEKDICVVFKDETDCGACSEHCPTQAVKMVPYKDSLRIPQVTPEICVGCGGCEYICPVRPQRAIHVVANTEHITVKKPEYEKVKDVEVTDFGF